MKIETVMALNDAGVDTEGALRRFSGNSELYGRFLIKFLSDDNYGKIIPALTDGDLDTAMMAAHTLKGISANLGMNKLFQVSSEIVENIRSGNSDMALSQCDALKASYLEICEALSIENA